MIEEVVDEAGTEAIAQRLSAELRHGDTLLLHGDLGAGKTTFVRHLVAALGSPAPVSSPTFTLIHEYRGGRLRVCHVDAYRLRCAAEAEDAGLFEYFDGTWLVVVEWAERIVDALPVGRCWDIVLTETGPESRTIAVDPPEDDAC